jgi:hypothetical protein
VIEMYASKRSYYGAGIPGTCQAFLGNVCLLIRIISLLHACLASGGNGYTNNTQLR